MTFEDAVREIESHQFSGRVNLASDLRTFIRAMEDEQSVAVLREKMDDRRTPMKLVRRLQELTSQLIDLRYENPWDSALATYVWLLASKEEELGRLAAGIVIRAINCWWVEKIARTILARRPLHSEAHTETVESKFGELRKAKLISEGGEAIFSYLYSDYGQVLEAEMEFTELKKESFAKKSTTVSLELKQDLSLFPVYINSKSSKAA